MLGLRLLVVLVAATLRVQAAAMPICSSAVYCPSSCSNNTRRPMESTISTQLQQSNSTGALQFRNSAAKAIATARTFPGIVRDLIGGLHLSLQYHCCYTPAELDAIGSITASIKWEPFAVRFRFVVCIGGALIVLVDPVSQGKLTALVSQVEFEMQVAGLPVHRFRAEEAPFHASLATFNGTYDMAKALPVINNALAEWWNTEPIVINEFVLEGTNWTFHATSRNT